MNRKFLLSLSFFCASFFLYSTSFGAFISVSNSLAGEENNIRFSELFPNETASVTLARPDGSALDFPVQADSSGIATLSLYGLHVRLTGNYTLTIHRPTGDLQKIFSVLSGPVSAYQSQIFLDHPSVEANGTAASAFTITLRDSQGNPIVGKSIQAFSSRNTDTITFQNTTNNQGQATGTITSTVPGVSVLSVLAGNILLFQKPQVVFYLSSPALRNVGSMGEPSYGEYLKAQLFGDQQATQVAYFTLENIKTTPMIGETLNVKVVAKDVSGNTVTGYQGTVRFAAPSDLRATLPSDYKFTFEDQGSHTFYLAVAFQTPGAQTLEVHDLDDARRSGEVTLNVAMSSTPVPPPTTPGITLLTPTPGTFRSSRMTITGQAVNVSSVRLQDGNTVLTDNLAVDAKGNFVFQTPALADGTHVFKAYDPNSSLTSNEISIQIDRSAPQNIQVIVEPQGLMDPDQEFKVRVLSQDPLSAASVTFNGVKEDLIPSGNEFQTTLTAPKIKGDYPVDVMATDLLGNEGQYPNSATITVKDSMVAANSGNDMIPPSSVSNVVSESGDGKITLFWSPAIDQSGIKQYRIEFGSQDLNVSDGSGPVVFDQYNITPDDRTKWYVNNLSDNKKYFFRVVAFDNQGNSGPSSTVIEAVTKSAQIKGKTVQKKPAATPRSGSSAWISLWVGLVVSSGLFFFARRKM